MIELQSICFKQLYSNSYNDPIQPKDKSTIHNTHVFRKQGNGYVFKKHFLQKYFHIFSLFLYIYTFVILEKKSFFNNTWGFVFLVGCTVLKIFGYL